MKNLTVGDLRKAIEGASDDMEVVTWRTNLDNDDFWVNCSFARVALVEANQENLANWKETPGVKLSIS